MTVHTKSAATQASTAIIGLVLLVGITVLLGAVLGVLALDMVQDQGDPTPWDEHAPNATFDIERIGDSALVTHDGGESIGTTTLEMRGDLETDPASFDGQTVDDGDSVMVDLETTENATVRVVWTTAYSQDVLTEATV